MADISSLFCSCLQMVPFRTYFTIMWMSLSVSEQFDWTAWLSKCKLEKHHGRKSTRIQTSIKWKWNLRVHWAVWAATAGGKGELAPPPLTWNLKKMTSYAALLRHIINFLSRLRGARIIHPYSLFIAARKILHAENCIEQIWLFPYRVRTECGSAPFRIF